MAKVKASLIGVPPSAFISDKAFKIELLLSVKTWLQFTSTSAIPPPLKVIKEIRDLEGKSAMKSWNTFLTLSIL